MYTPFLRSFFYKEIRRMKRIGVIGIIVQGDKSTVATMQNIFSDFSDIIIGRMGVPRDSINVISLIVEGSLEKISALTGKLGKINGITVKSAMTNFEINII